MADETLRRILRAEGSEAWNEWRKQNPKARIKLNHADLGSADLEGINLTRANLSGAKLLLANLRGANLRNSNLSDTDLRAAVLRGADLRSANLKNANLRGAYLYGADLRNAFLAEANLEHAEVNGVNFARSQMDHTKLTNLDLEKARGLERVVHLSYSEVSISTIYLSGGNIPESFLRGAGVPEPFIVQMKSLVAAMSPIEFYSCFISYSSKDHEFAARLHADLQTKNVRCWFAPEDLKIGDKFRTRIEESIRIYDKLIVVLSENSIQSPWVEEEVEAALEKERQQNKLVLFPIRLDDAVMVTKQAWAASLRRTRHIGEFNNWKDHDEYKKAFERLLRDLKDESAKAAVTTD